MESQEAVIQCLLSHKDPKIRQAAKVIKASSDRRKTILRAVQTMLDQLKLDVKYLVFDLEATRRERDALKR